MKIDAGSGLCLLVMSLRGQDACLRNCQSRTSRLYSAKRTNVEQNCAILLLLDNMVLKDLVVQGLRWFHGRRHGGDVKYRLYKGVDTNAEQQEW